MRCNTFSPRLTSANLSSAIDAVRPDHWMYRTFTDALATYRQIEAAGGWPTVADGPHVAPRCDGYRASPICAVVYRPVAIMGDAATAEQAPCSTSPSSSLEALPGAALFGARWGSRLPHASRIERGRCTAHRSDPGQPRARALGIASERADGDFVIVDVAGFEVRYVRDRAVIWKTRAQVGQPYRQTPIFRSTIEEVVLNPTWTVPPGILAKDILPAARRDPAYLEKRGLRVIDRDGRPVDSDERRFQADIPARRFRS